MKHITLDAVEWARKRLHNSCKSLFADFLILKREGLNLGSPVVISSISTADSATRLMGVKRSDGGAIDEDHYYFNPFANVKFWRHDEYPRSGTYTTVERSPPIRRMMDVSRVGEGVEIGLKPDYLDRLQETFRIRAANPVAIDPIAFAVWCSRYDELPDELTDSELVTRVFGEYGLTADETSILFGTPNVDLSSIFSQASFPADTWAGILLSEEAEAGPTAQATLPLAAASEETAEESLPEDLLEFLRGQLLLPRSLLRQLVTLVRAGKHIILTGPPGTGKTTLVARLAEASQKASAKYDLPSCDGILFTTATADWSTFDTVGGYVPDATGTGLSFHEGIFLEAIRENRWVVIDELNRADVDKAFGQMFTLLSGHAVRSPFRDGTFPVELVPNPNVSGSSRDGGSATYMVGGAWRILATMNTFDRNLLFQLSSAFVRRFAVIYVGVPPAQDLKAWIAQRDLLPEEIGHLSELIDRVAAVRPLGPAIWSDVADYMEIRRSEAASTGGAAALLEALTAFVLPQMDGLEPERLLTFRDSLLELFASEDERQELERLFQELF